jgi:serine/threonine protein kinase
MAPEKSVSILWGEFELGAMIGAGSFGHVYDGKHVKTGKVFAVKRFKNKYNSKKKAFE